MKRRIRIAFDIDGSVVDFQAHIRQIAQGMCGSELPDSEGFDLCEPWGMTEKEIWEILRVGYKQWQLTPIFDYVPELMETLWERTREPIQFVTARPKEFAHHTHLLVSRFMGEVPYQIAFASGFDKPYFLGGYSYVLEDRRRTAIDLAENHGKIVFLVDAPYNQMPNHQRIVRIRGPRDLKQSVYMLTETDLRIAGRRATG